MAGGLECITVVESASRLRDVLTDINPTSETLEILEAGCGPQWDLGPLPRRSRITGLDVDPAAIDRRLGEVGDLDAAVLGDVLDKASFPPGSFDVIYSAYVLEHIPNAESAVLNFGYWLRPGGRLVLRLPDPSSVYGWLARTTPHRAHVWYYRWFHRDPSAGRPGHSPYPTHYSSVLSIDGMKQVASTAGLQLVAVYGETAFTLAGAKQSVVRIVTRVVQRLSMGRLARDHENLCWVFEKS